MANFASECDQDDVELRARLVLTLVTGVGPVIVRRLLDRFGTCREILSQPASRLAEINGLGQELARRIVSAGNDRLATEQWQLCQQQGIHVLPPDSSQFPPMLAEIYDPPLLLFGRGQWLPQDRLSVAIVGTRHATSYGLRVAERLGGALARSGMTVVSGLARGIDAAAHRGALSAGGRTVAVLGSGLLNIYPPDHRDLAAAVARQGMVFSEAPPLRRPLRGAFPQRNRLISGISLGVVVVEAARQSGALITARHALEQGREVFAVPGPIDSRVAAGCHQLLRDGARLVESVDDILQELGSLVAAATQSEAEPVHHPAQLLLDESEQQVLQVISTSPQTIDEVIVSSGMTAPRVMAILTALELKHLIQRPDGCRVCRACSLP